MFKLAITVLAMASLAFASEQKVEHNDYNDAHPAPQAHHSGYYYPYYGYYPYYNYHPAPYYYHPGYYYHPAYVPYDHHYQHHAPAHYPGLVFIGKFEGTCRGAANGIYFVDDRSFAYCSNGIKTIQSCADGSANPAYSKFEKGRYYHFSEFCSVNLVAQQQVPGYDVHHSAEVKQQEKAAQY